MWAKHRYQTQYTDPSTGDVLMQSRWYAPTSGTFRSRDTWSGNLNTPVSLNRYTYAHNNPVRYSDPTGRCIEICDGQLKSTNTIDPRGGPIKLSPVRQSTQRIANEVTGQVSTLTQDATLTLPASVEVIILESSTATTYQFQGGYQLHVPKTDGMSVRTALEIATAPPAIGDVADVGWCGFDGFRLLFRGGSKLDAGASCGAMMIPVGTAGSAHLADDALSVTDDIVGFGDEFGDIVGATCRNSFASDTQVVMGDGQTTKGIDEIVAGDLVWATDPEQSITGPRVVLASWPHEDDLLDLRTDRGTVTTTEDHRFWNATDSEWQQIATIDSGDELLSVDGSPVSVYGLDWTKRHTAAAYDLTVEGLHSYYVEVGSEAVLVHNCGSITYGPLDELGRPTGATAILTPGMVNTGTDAYRGIKPPGWASDSGFGRGHLIGRQLGGSGKIPENLVTLIQNPVNSPIMRGFENSVRQSLGGGATVAYAVTPIYQGTVGMAIGVTIKAQGSDGLDLFVTVLNRAP